MSAYPISDYGYLAPHYGMGGWGLGASKPKAVKLTTAQVKAKNVATQQKAQASTAARAAAAPATAAKNQARADDYRQREAAARAAGNTKLAKQMANAAKTYEKIAGSNLQRAATFETKVVQAARTGSLSPAIAQAIAVNPTLAPTVAAQLPPEYVAAQRAAAGVAPSAPPGLPPGMPMIPGPVPGSYMPGYGPAPLPPTAKLPDLMAATAPLTDQTMYANPQPGPQYAPPGGGGVEWFDYPAAPDGMAYPTAQYVPPPAAPIEWAAAPPQYVPPPPPPPQYPALPPATGWADVLPPNVAPQYDYGVPYYYDAITGDPYGYSPPADYYSQPATYDAYPSGGGYDYAPTDYSGGYGYDMYGGDPYSGYGMYGLGSWLSSAFKKVTGSKLSDVTKSVFAPIAGGFVGGAVNLVAPGVGTSLTRLVDVVLANGQRATVSVPAGSTPNAAGAVKAQFVPKAIPVGITNPSAPAPVAAATANAPGSASDPKAWIMPAAIIGAALVLSGVLGGRR